MKRSGDVTAAAIVLFFGSALLVFMIGLVLLAAMLTQAPQEQRDAQAMGSIIYAFFAAWGIVTGIGILKLRPWARISMIVLSAVAMFVCVCVSIVLMLVPGVLRDTPNVSPATVKMIVAVGILILLVPVAISVWWLILFTRKRVILEFASRDASAAILAVPQPGEATSLALPPTFIASGTPQIPTSVRVVAIVILALLPFSLFGLFTAARSHLSTNMILGILFTGFPAWLHVAVILIIQVVLSIETLRKKLWALYGLIAWLVFGIANEVLYLIFPARIRFIDAVVRSRPIPPGMSLETMKSFVGGLLRISMGVSALLTVVALYFLFTRRKAYREAC